ncbi:FAD-dependent oxidoreductase (plasmid) [Streptomyces sp. NBC_01340]|nr:MULTISPECIES: FAD-dependent oxidoreductase [unclassified Streptomyces]WSI44875.1 FAD-dependent oxidoreductase [Streptomyces sp. NBC_01340]
MTGNRASGFRSPSLPSGAHDNRTRAAVPGAQRTQPQTLPDGDRGSGRRSCRWGAVGALGAAGSAAAASSGKRVAVLGGGVSGLSAAHELAEHGYEVTVYEYYDALGGKARSMDVPGTGTGGRKPLPGEHGFRFFPGFYRNLPDTMRRIPFPGNANGVHGNLRSGTEALFARGSGRSDLHFPLRRVTTPPAPGDLTPSWIRDQILSVLDLATHLPANEAAYFADRLLVHLTTAKMLKQQRHRGDQTPSTGLRSGA